MTQNANFHFMYLVIFFILFYFYLKKESISSYLLYFNVMISDSHGGVGHC